MLADTITIIATISIAVIALLVSIWQGLVTRRHNRLSVTPHIDISLQKYRERFGFLMDNTGVGPAVIEWFSIRIDDKEIPYESGSGGWKEACTNIGIDNLNISYAFYKAGDFMKSGTSFWALRWDDSGTASEEQLKSVADRFQHIHLSIGYRSVYGDRFAAFR